MMGRASAFLMGLGMVCLAFAAAGEERQVTSSPTNHMLDNNDNFSADGRFLCYDTREVVGPGIENSQSVAKVEVATGVETVLYAGSSVIGAQAAPGIGAASFSPVEDKIIFIHGPRVSDVPRRGYYAKPNRNGAEALGDGSQRMAWVDYRDLETGRDTLAGAHRGGTHRHEYTLDGKRIGFTYDDMLLPQYARTIGYMEKNPQAPGGATHYFAILVPVVLEEEAKPGDVRRAASDSWIGKHGLMRAFIGEVMNDDGKTFEESLFVIDVPADVDITTADPGSATRYPGTPKGVGIRRVTHGWAGGTVRGTVEGDRIAYYGLAEDESVQVFIIPSDGSDQDPDPAKRPVQATHFPEEAGAGLRWHPSGNSIACISNNGVAVTCVQPGPRFGETVFLTEEGDAPERSQLVWSPDGKTLAFVKRIPTFDATRRRLRCYDGQDFAQIFVVDFPDADGDGVAEAAGTPDAS